MPSGAGEVRAQQLALLARLQHERATDARVGGWLVDHVVGNLQSKPLFPRPIRGDIEPTVVIHNLDNVHVDIFTLDLDETIQVG